MTTLRGVSGVNQSARIPHAGSYQMHRTGSGLQTVRESGQASGEEEFWTVLPFPPWLTLNPGWNDRDPRVLIDSRPVIVV